MASTLTVEHVAAIMPNARSNGLDSEFEHLLAVCRREGITTKLRFAAFIANIAVESAELHYVREIHDGSDYEWRDDLGNIYAGDGVRFRGRGYIQITGRANYTAISEARGIDCVNHPELLEQMPAAWDSAGWYWTTRGNNLYYEQPDNPRYQQWPVNLNEFADEEDFDATCYGVNGGWNGYNERVAYYDVAMNMLPDDLDLSESLREEEEPEVTEEPAVANSVLVYTDDDAYIRARDTDAYVWMLQGSNTPAKADGSGYIYVPGLPGGGSDAAARAPYQADKLVTAAGSDTWLCTASGSYIQGEGMSDHDLQANLSGWLWDRTAWEAKPKDDRFWPVADTPADPNSWSYVERHPTRYNWVASVERLARDLCNNFPVWCNTYVQHPPDYPDHEWYSIDVWNPGGRGYWLDTNVHMQVRDHVMDDPDPPMLAWVCSFYEIWTPDVGWRWFSNDTDPATDYAHVYHLHMSFALDS